MSVSSRTVLRTVHCFFFISLFSLLFISSAGALTLLPGATSGSGATCGGSGIGSYPTDPMDPNFGKVCCAPKGKDCEYCKENPEECEDNRTLQLIVPGMRNQERSPTGKLRLKENAPEREAIKELLKSPCNIVRVLHYDENQHPNLARAELLNGIVDIVREFGLYPNFEGSGIGSINIAGYSLGGALIASAPELNHIAELGPLELNTFGSPFNMSNPEFGVEFLIALGIVPKASLEVGSGTLKIPEHSFPVNVHIHHKTSNGIGQEEQEPSNFPVKPKKTPHPERDHISIVKDMPAALTPKNCECKGESCESQEENQEELNRLFVQTTQNY